MSMLMTQQQQQMQMPYQTPQLSPGSGRFPAPTATRIHQAAEAGYRRLEPLRKYRRKFVREYVGNYYSEDNQETRVHNMINLSINVWASNIVADIPEYRVSTPRFDLRPYCDVVALALNQLATKLEVDRLYREVFIDSLMAPFGIVRTFLNQGHNVIDVGNSTIDLGQVATMRVDFDDFVIDPVARSLAEAFFFGHRYRLVRQMAMESGLFDERARGLIERLPRLGSGDNNGAGGGWFDDTGGVTSIAGMYGRGANGIGQEDVVYDVIELVDLYFPREKKIRTISGLSSGRREVLAEHDWYGPDTGPYDFLYYQPNPNNPIPVIPIGILHDLHDYANRMAMKLVDQVVSSKTVIAYNRQGGQRSIDDAMTIRNARSGDFVGLNNTDNVQTYQVGALDPKLPEFLAFIKNAFSEASGSIDQLGGTGSTGNTATEVQILQNNASARVGDMADQMYKFAARVARSQLWYLHNDPYINMPLIKRLPNGHELPVEYSAETRDGEWLDYNVAVEMLSMARRDPNTRAAQLQQMFAQTIPAMVQTWVQSMTPGGPLFNIEEALRRIGNEQGIRDLDAVWSTDAMRMLNAAPLMQGPQPMRASPGRMAGGGGGMMGGMGEGMVRDDGRGGSVFGGQQTRFGSEFAGAGGGYGRGPMRVI